MPAISLTRPPIRPVPSDAALAATLARVDWRAVELDPARIGFRRPGMAVTLNGVAQGYITDRVADLLRGRGFENVLVELGEVRALGRRPDSDPWRAGIADPKDPSAVLLELPLLDAALATSGGYGTWFDPAHRHHHLLRPGHRPQCRPPCRGLGHGSPSHGGGCPVHGVDDSACGSGKTAAGDIRAGYGLPLRTRRPTGDSRRMMVPSTMAL